MEKAKKQIKKIIKSDNLPFIFFFILLVIFHFSIRKFTADDADFFGNILSSGVNIIDFITERYSTWTSRVIIEFFLVILAKYELVIWRFLDIGVYLLLAKTISKISFSENKKFNNYFICISLFLLPIVTLNGAGWLSTSLNYLWVCTFGLFSLSIIVDYIKEKKIAFWKYPIYLFTTIYACNHEQMVVVMFCVLGAFLIYELFKKKIKYVVTKEKMIILMFLITILSMVFILTCPGNQIRKTEETDNWLPEHQEYSIVEKAELGLTSTMSKLVLDKNNLFIILTAVIFICVLLKEKNKIYKFIAAIPLFASCSYTFFSNYLIAMLPSSVGVIERFKQEQLVMGLNQINIVDLGVILGYIGIIIVILACFYIIFKKDIKFFICSGVLTLGFITRFIMALSPTIFASGERTFVFLYISFLICSCMVIEKIPKLNKEYFGKN